MNWLVRLILMALGIFRALPPDTRQQIIDKIVDKIVDALEPHLRRYFQEAR